MNTAEHERLEEARTLTKPWRRFGPYVSDRQWGPVREDSSPEGKAWEYFSHDHARSRAYRWGEDGIAGFCDDQQLLCLSSALWSTRDPILKERFFGLSGPEGSHGEDVKEVSYYLEATLSHSYLQVLSKYPQAAYPYASLLQKYQPEAKTEPEYELVDTGIFDEGRYFDVFVEYAKNALEDILMRVRVVNRGPEAAPIVVLPQAWFRNTWSWGRGTKRRILRAYDPDVVALSHPLLGEFVLHGDTGQGLGASHQTGWTGLMATLPSEATPTALPHDSAEAAARPKVSIREAVRP